MQISKYIFRAYDIRGIVGNDLNEDVAEAIGKALGTIAQEQGQNCFCVGYDGRHSSPILAKALHKGIIASGANVIDIGVVPTPVLYFATEFLHTGTGVMITGSHNPPDYNGFKLLINGNSLALDDITQIYDYIKSNHFSSGEGTILSKNIDQDYIDAIIARQGDTGQKQKKVVIDAGNAVSANIAPKLFSQLGYEVIPLFCVVDGDFPNHHPDPSKLENLQDLQQAVLKHKADIGIAFDGDGDRMGVVSDKGDVIFPDKAMMLLAEDMLSRHQGSTVIVDVKSSPLLVDHIEHNGGNALVWKTGHSLIKRKMKETKALLAGEMSGHIFLAENWYGFDDALLAAVQLMAIVHGSTEPISSIFARYPVWHSTPEISIATTDKEKFAIVDALIAEGDFAYGNVNYIDGIRVEYPKGWGLIRCSNTTPTLVLRFEGQQQTDLVEIIDKLRTELTKVAPHLDLSILDNYIS